MPIILPNIPKNGIKDINMDDVWELGTFTAKHCGWEFKVKNEDLTLTKLRWYNYAEYPLTRRVLIYDWPNGDLLTYVDIEADSQSWGTVDVDRPRILKANTVYRIFIKIPKIIPYFFTEVKNVTFNETDFDFKSCRYTDDFIQVFETKNIIEFPDFEYTV